MSVKRILRRMLLGLLLGGRSLFGISMSSEKIEELLYSNNQPRAEETVSDNKTKERANRNNGSAEERLKTHLRVVIPLRLQAKEVHCRTPRVRQCCLRSDIGILAEKGLASHGYLARVGQRICTHVKQAIPDLDAYARVPNHHPIPKPGFRKTFSKIRLSWRGREIFGEQIELFIIPRNIGPQNVGKEIPRPSLDLDGWNRIRKRPVRDGRLDDGACQPKTEVTLVQAHGIVTKAIVIRRKRRRRTRDREVQTE